MSLDLNLNKEFENQQLDQSFSDYLSRLGDLSADTFASRYNASRPRVTMRMTDHSTVPNIEPDPDFL